ncbi:MAG: hypothetical protein D9V47_01835 [Clostridia bacterium]|nr:MAG: hypothetical protein D9V47_01835 [Clostridia bacterium]
MKKDFLAISGPVTAADQVLDYYLAPETGPKPTASYWLKEAAAGLGETPEPDPSQVRATMALLERQWREKARPVLADLAGHPVVAAFLQEADQAFVTAGQGGRANFLRAHAYFHDFSLLLAGQLPAYPVILQTGVEPPPQIP